MAEPTAQEVTQFFQTTDTFMKNFARLTSPETQSKVYASNDPALIADYEQLRSRGSTLKSTIENAVGAWESAKLTYATATDKTSMYIGDAIDTIRSWWGAGPKADLQGLGILQFPIAAVAVAGIVASGFLLNSLMSRIFVRIEAASLEESGMTRAQAIKVASGTLAPTFFQALNVPLLVGGALAIYLLMRN